jgi:pimeloyl-ACP methyl ester carboxylesterase
MSLWATRAGFRFLSPHAPSVAARWAEHLFLTPRRHIRPYWEYEQLLSAREDRVPYEGGWLPTWTWGGGAEAPTALLVHGWEGRGSQLGRFVDPLVSRGFRVVTFDAPGHGQSTLPVGSLVEHARALVEVGRAFGKVHAVIGHSVGGAAALLATRFGFEASRFALLAPPFSPSQFASQFATFLGIEDAVKRRMIVRIEERYGIPFAEIDARLDAPRVEAPVLVVHDREDRVVDVADGRALARLAPHGTFVETTGLGHYAVLRAPRVIRTVERFVAEGAPASSSFEATLDGELFLRSTRWTRAI